MKEETNDDLARVDTMGEADQPLTAASHEQAVNPVELRLRHYLTVIMDADDSAAQADADVARVIAKEGQTLRLTRANSAYFHQLRLHIAQDPTLADAIAVFYRTGDHMTPIGLAVSDELHWPVGFENELLDIEIKIQKARQERRSPDGDGHEKGVVVGRESECPKDPQAARLVEAVKPAAGEPADAHPAARSTFPDHIDREGRGHWIADCDAPPAAPADAHTPRPSFPIEHVTEWQCRFVFEDQRCCGLALDHDGDHVPADGTGYQEQGALLAWLNTEQKQAERWGYSASGVYRFMLSGPELMRLRHGLEGQATALTAAIATIRAKWLKADTDRHAAEQRVVALQLEIQELKNENETLHARMDTMGTSTDSLTAPTNGVK